MRDAGEEADDGQPDMMTNDDESYHTALLHTLVLATCQTMH